MRTSLCFIFLLFVTAFAFGQEPDVPQHVKFDASTDYKALEPQLRACISWLKQTPASPNTAKRKEVKSFIVKWISNCPYVTVHIEQYIARVIDNNSDLLIIYMSSYCLNELEKANDTFGSSKKGILDIMEFYTANKGLLSRDRDIENLIKLQAQGKLDKWLNDRIN